MSKKEKSVLHVRSRENICCCKQNKCPWAVLFLIGFREFSLNLTLYHITLMCNLILYHITLITVADLLLVSSSFEFFSFKNFILAKHLLQCFWINTAALFFLKIRRWNKKFIACFWIIRAALSLSYKESISTEQLGLQFPPIFWCIRMTI